MTTRRTNRKPPPPTRARGELQADLLNFVIEYKVQNEGAPPSFREVADALDVCQSAAYVAALRLVRKGVLAFNDRGKLITGGTYLPPGKLPKQT